MRFMSSTLYPETICKKKPNSYHCNSVYSNFIFFCLRKLRRMSKTNHENVPYIHRQYQRFISIFFSFCQFLLRNTLFYFSIAHIFDLLKVYFFLLFIDLSRSTFDIFNFPRIVWFYFVWCGRIYTELFSFILKQSASSKETTHNNNRNERNWQRQG